MSINAAHFIVQFCYSLNVCLGIIYCIGPINYRRILGVLFLVIAYVMINFELVYTKNLLYYPFLFLTFIPVSLLFGPLANYALVRHLGLQQPKWRYWIIHLALPVIVTGILSPILLTSNELKLAIINGLYYESSSLLYDTTSVICVASILFYIGILFKQLPAIHRIQAKHSLFNVLLIALIVGILLSGFSFASILFHSLDLLLIGNTIFSMLSITAYGLHIKFPDFMPQLLQKIKQNKLRQSYLANVNVTKTLDKLNHLMSDEFVYRDMDLSLNSLADQLTISTHQLSELINFKLGKNFTTFVMEFRVQEAIEKLKNEPNKTILRIAYDVGFKSNSAFYIAFKKVTGKSPKDYR